MIILFIGLRNVARVLLITSPSVHHLERQLLSIVGNTFPPLAHSTLLTMHRCPRRGQPMVNPPIIPPNSPTTPNPFIANAQSLQHYQESISVIGNTRRRGSGSGPTAIAPTVVTTEPIQDEPQAVPTSPAPLSAAAGHLQCLAVTPPRDSEHSQTLPIIETTGAEPEAQPSVHEEHGSHTSERRDDERESSRHDKEEDANEDADPHPQPSTDLPPGGDPEDHQVEGEGVVVEAADLLEDPEMILMMMKIILVNSSIS
ncbi:hypothetical protein BT96DRAFT_932333 [Gymnopus androsaceus JB14]|uniref:Uncharacterized protein n=1 Tax=Gymnopus androsaceus JB14 TaxID=1447944 RepID=A0A6A4IJ97_9AGAR|nr:hypothetical protein BT96DRAFT_932333 [Gymnopus androsaceus JB14]